MLSSIETFRVLCHCLSLQEEPASLALLRDKMTSGDMSWERLIRQADREMVTPTLWSALNKKRLLDAVPDETRELLRRRHQVNTVKNGQLKQQANEVAACLNAIDIVPIVLKGGVCFYESDAVVMGDRIMADLDFVVPEVDMDRCIEALRAAGYEPRGMAGEWTYHYLPMYRKGTLAEIEVHVFIGEQRHVLTPAEAWLEAVRLPTDKIKIKALSPTHRVLHNIFHSEVQDLGYRLGFTALRQLHDLEKISLFHGKSVDWTWISNRMAEHGLEKELCARLYLAERLVSMPMPSGVQVTWLARLHYHRCLAKIGSRLLMKATMIWEAGISRFKPHHIDLIYNCGTKFVSVTIYRMRHAAYLISKYCGRIWSTVMAGRRLH